MPLPKSKAILFLSGVSPGLTITTSNFYTVVGGLTLPNGDDKSSSVTLSPSFPFLGSADGIVYVSFCPLLAAALRDGITESAAL